MPSTAFFKVFGFEILVRYRELPTLSLVGIFVRVYAFFMTAGFKSTSSVVIYSIGVLFLSKPASKIVFTLNLNVSVFFNKSKIT